MAVTIFGKRRLLHRLGLDTLLAIPVHIAGAGRSKLLDQRRLAMTDS